MDLIAIGQAVEMQVSLFFESLQWKLEQGELASMQVFHRFLEETCLDETAALGLSLEDQLYLLENHAEHAGFELGEVKIRHLRRSLETLAVHVIHRRAEPRILEIFQELESFLERLRLRALRSSVLEPVRLGASLRGALGGREVSRV